MKQEELVNLDQYQTPKQKGKSRNPYAVRPTGEMYKNPEAHSDLSLPEGVSDAREYCLDYYSKALIEGMGFKTLKEMNVFIAEVWKWGEKKIERENLHQAKALIEMIEANPTLAKLVKEQLLKTQ